MPAYGLLVRPVGIARDAVSLNEALRSLRAPVLMPFHRLQTEI